MPRLRAVLLVTIIALFFQSTPGSALVKFDFEQKFFNEPGEPVLDHYLLEQDGVYHLFYLRGDPAVDVGHATSTDLIHWKREDPVLYPGTWDSKLWAPHLIKYPTGNVWLMFYTGVNNAFSQQTGVAFSTDLISWTKYPQPVYHPDPVWAEWYPDSWAHGRDPHVIEHDGQYYLFNTAKTWTNQGAVACAVSSDLINWTDIGPVYVHYTWHVMESIFVMERNGRFHMFFTEEGVNGTSHMSSDNLLSGWDVIANRRIIDTGHAPQVSFLSDGTEIFSRHQVYNDNRGFQMHTIRLDTLRWAGEIPYPYKPYPLASDWTVESGSAFSIQPTFMNNPYARFEDVEPTFQGQSWIGSKERYSGPLGFGLPGGLRGEEAVGSMRSRTFTIGGSSMTLLVGGTNDPDSCYVALVDANTGKILRKETGRGIDEMDERAWDIFPLIGRSAYIRIVDNALTGFINVDYIVESATPIDVPEGGGRTMKKPGMGTAASREEALALQPLTATPNPFNPTTTVSFEIAAPAFTRVQIYDVSGTLVRELMSRRLPAGVHSVTWDGVGDGGRAMASGVYFCRLVVGGDIVATRKLTLLK